MHLIGRLLGRLFRLIRRSGGAAGVDLGELAQEALAGALSPFPIFVFFLLHFAVRFLVRVVGRVQLSQDALARLFLALLPFADEADAPPGRAGAIFVDLVDDADQLVDRAQIAFRHLFGGEAQSRVEPGELQPLMQGVRLAAPAFERLIDDLADALARDCLLLGDGVVGPALLHEGEDAGVALGAGGGVDEAGVAVGHEEGLTEKKMEKIHDIPIFRKKFDRMKQRRLESSNIFKAIPGLSEATPDKGDLPKRGGYEL